ncbi:hypothetical protein LAUMK41_02481 [Mycobacterium attenuatum]|nr:hypothetical protein LAUMK41_02481 [Mycobacterium attenuatum]
MLPQTATSEVVRVSAELFPASLPIVATLGGRVDGRAWLEELPRTVARLQSRWCLRLHAPFHGGSCSWVAPAHLPDGQSVVLKVSWPHREAVGEARALRLWDGNAAVRLLREDREHHALLLERCNPGRPLGSSHHLSVTERLLVGARVLGELWQTPVPDQAGLELLGDVTAEWADLVENRMARLEPGFDAGLVAHGVRMLRELPAGAARTVVMHGDFNPGNVLSSLRGWLTIDAKPMIGDPGYDPWPLVEQIDDPFAYTDVHSVLTERFTLITEALGEDTARLQAWGLARCVETALDAAAGGDIVDAQTALNKARALAELLGI